MTKKQKELLIKETKSWTPEQWEEYLQKKVDKNLKEDLLPLNFDEKTPGNFNQFQGLEKPVEEKKNLEFIFKSAFNKLTKRQQIVLKLIFYKGLTQKQIAKKLKISRNSVKVIKAQGLRRLKGLLSPTLSPIYPIVGAGVMEKWIFQFPNDISCSKHNYFQKLNVNCDRVSA